MKRVEEIYINYNFLCNFPAVLKLYEMNGLYTLPNILHIFSFTLDGWFSCLSMLTNSILPMHNRQTVAINAVMPYGTKTF